MTALFLIATASAHVGGLLQGIDILLEHGVSVETSFGLLRATDSENYSWLCHEAITTSDALITPRYTESTDGVLLGVVPVLEQARESGVALYRTEDGCDWTPASGLDDLTLTDAIFDPADPTQAWVITADLTDGVDNHILRSTDGGQSFSTTLTSSQRLFRTVAASPAGSIWASAVWYDDSTGFVYHSTDGETFTEVAVPMPDLDDSVDVDVVAVSPDDPQTAWVVVGPYGGDALLRTTDGGQSFTEVFSTEGDIISGTAQPGGAVWIAVSGQTFYRADDGETFTLVESAPTGLAVSAADGTAWLATDALINAGSIAFSSADDGASFASSMHLSTLNPPPACDADSHSVDLCDPLWEKLEVRLPLPVTDGDSGDTEESGDDTGGPDDTGVVDETCGCGESSAALVLAVGLLGLGRRRR